MRTTYSVPKSPLTIAIVTAALLVAAIIGGVGGYVVKGALGATPVPQSLAAGSGNASLAESRSQIYVQGGRPAVVYATAQPIVYVQGDRPQAVYDEVARLARR
jgi:hypothetical protein